MLERGQAPALKLSVGNPQQHKGDSIMSLNHAVIHGNLIRDPETRQVGDKGTVTRFALAVNAPGKGRDNEDPPPHIFDIEVWDRQAELCQEYLHKGSPAIVEGRLQQDRWVDRASGQNHSKVIIKAHRVEFLPDGRKGASNGAPDATDGNSSESQPDGTTETKGFDASGAEREAVKAPF